MRRLLILALVLFAVSLGVQLAMIGLGTQLHAVRAFMNSAREGALYGVPAVICAGVAIAMGRHGSVGANVMAAILCVAMPLLGGTVILVVDCLILERCFCLGSECP